MECSACGGYYYVKGTETKYLHADGLSTFDTATSDKDAIRTESGLYIVSGYKGNSGSSATSITSGGTLTVKEAEAFAQWNATITAAE